MTVPPVPMLVEAHGIGGRSDLPLPLDLVLQAAAVALLVSFLVLGVFWTAPRFRGGAAGRPLPGWFEAGVDSRSVAWAGQAVALVGALAVGVVGLAGPYDARNPAPYVVYVGFWVGVPVVSMLVGPVAVAWHPLRLVHAVLVRMPGLPGPGGLRPYPAWLGHGPAALGLLAFTWLELAAPDRSSPRVVVAFVAAYAVAQLAGALVFGAVWFDRADGFAVYVSLLARLAPFGRRDDGRIVVRSPFDGLAATPPHPGLVAVVAVCLGSTAFDSVSGSLAWTRIAQTLPVPRVLLDTAGLVALVLVVAGSYLLAVRWAGAPRADQPPGGPALAPSLVPVVAGYLVAHYYSLLVVEGQRMLALLSDPFGTGADLLGLTGTAPDLSLASPGIVAGVQVTAVLAGHVLGVVAAHDRALALYPAERRLAGQVPLLVLMVGYTTGGLLLLLAA